MKSQFHKSVGALINLQQGGTAYWQPRNQIIKCEREDCSISIHMRTFPISKTSLAHINNQYAKQVFV